MKDNLLLDPVIADATKAAIDQVLVSANSSFGHLVKLANLDPKAHLRHADLRDVDFTDTDLTGYDFTGCDLRGAHGIRVDWDPENTVLTDALLEDSLFEHRMKIQAALHNDETRLLHRKLRGMRWGDQIIWAMRALRKDAPSLERDRLIAAAVFEETDDSFLKGEMLKYLEKSASDQEDGLYGFMLDIINLHSQDYHLIGKTVRILIKSRRRNSPHLAAAIESLLHSHDSRIVALAVEALVSCAPDRATIRRVAEIALARPEPQLHGAFIGPLIRRLGPQFDLVARNPFTKDYRDERAPLEANEVLVLTRNIRRGYSDEREGILNGTLKTPGIFMTHFGKAIEDNVLLDKFNEMFDVMASYGMRKRTVPIG